MVGNQGLLSFLYQFGDSIYVTSYSWLIDSLTGFGKVASALRKLEILDLSENYLDDSILTSLTELSSLKSLYLVNNNFITQN